MNDISNAPSGKTRVFHVITRFDKGGSAENTFLTVRDLDKDRYDVWLITGLSHESQMGEAESAAAGKNLADAQKSGARIIYVPTLVRSIEPINDLKTLFFLIRLCRRLQPHIMHTHTSKAGLLGRWAALMARVPLIIHTPHGHVFWGYFGTAKTALFIFLERLAARFTKRLIMLTKQEMMDHLSVNIAPKQKFTVIHSGVDFRPFRSITDDPTDLRKLFNIPPNAIVVGSVGRLTQIKGHHFLLEAMGRLAPRLPNLTCVLLGDGELRQDLEDLASRLGIRDRVLFLGWRADVARIISLFDIFAFPSLNEGMGKVLIEAMALDKPIIASAVGGITNLITQDENGILVPPGDAEILAKAIELLYLDKNERCAMGKRGKDRAALYSSDLMVEQIDSLYRELLHDGLAKKPHPQAITDPKPSGTHKVG